MSQRSSDASPFFFPAGDRAILCVHGFTGSPYEMRFLGERLHEAGFTVLGIKLPGHDSPEELAKARATQWINAVERGLALLEGAEGIVKPVGIAGISMGGALALHMAARVGRRLGAVAIFATPVFLSRVLTSTIRLARRVGLERVLPKIPKPGGSDIGDKEQRERNPSLGYTPIPAVYELSDLIDDVRGRLGEITQPLYMCHGGKDHTVPPENLDYIARRVASRHLEVERFPRSQHVITLDVDREEVARSATRFFLKHLGTPARVQVSLPESAYV